MGFIKIGLTRAFFCLGWGLMLALLPFSARADNYGDKVLFNIDKSYDSIGRSAALGDLVWSGERIYFYADEAWWRGLDSAGWTKYSAAFRGLDAEFSKNIYPKLTALFGTDVNPTVNRDGKITVLVHSMVKDAGGYINTADGYSKYQSSASNEREMIYFNSLFVDTPLAKAYLAHEFTHLITFNQKDRLRNVSDDVWLNEARADYSSTILGYDNPFAGGNFDRRIKSFAADSSKSLVEWANKPANYGAAHLFMQYLVDQYGIAVVADSMKTDKVGIAAIEYALSKNGFDIGFAQVFRNWLVALSVNDCRLGAQYCYKFADLQGFAVAPKINYLPNSDQVSLSVMYTTDYFAGSWQKIIGGAGDLSLDFSSDANARFLAPYLLCYAGGGPLGGASLAYGGECKVGNLEVDGEGKAKLNLPDFGRQYASLTLMPFASGKTAGFDNYIGNSLGYSFKIAITPRQNGTTTLPAIDDAKIQSLLAQIETLKKEIARVQAILAARASAIAKPAVPVSGNFSCKAIGVDLYFGVENNNQVKCLQEFLKAQGSAIYPSGAVTGRFSVDTQAAVIRFQEKFAAQILTPLGLKSGTGYVGAATRKIINNSLAN